MCRSNGASTTGVQMHILSEKKVLAKYQRIAKKTTMVTNKRVGSNEAFHGNVCLFIGVCCNFATRKYILNAVVSSYRAVHLVEQSRWLSCAGWVWSERKSNIQIWIWETGFHLYFPSIILYMHRARSMQQSPCPAFPDLKAGFSVFCPGSFLVFWKEDREAN